MTPIETAPPFAKITEASRLTGLSTYFLRQGCKSGSVPHVCNGNVYLVNIPALLRKLGAIEEGKAN